MILSNPFSQKEFTDFIDGFLPGFKLDLRKVEVGSTGFSEITRLGESTHLMTSVLIVRSKKNINSRISLTNNSFRILKSHNIYRALVVYVNDDDSIWRFSLLTALPEFDATGKVVISYSNPRRHSYVLGSDVGIATARKYLSNMGAIRDFDDLQFRFSIETVNQDFYREISEHFYSLVGKNETDKKVLSRPLLGFPNPEAGIVDRQDYAVRLLGRILFVWFLKQKISEDNVPLLPSELLDGGDISDILHSKIEPLFFEILNKAWNDRDTKFASIPYSIIPYLNGGLFHPFDGQSGDYYDSITHRSEIDIPDKWFSGLFQTLNTFNFTIDENLENDVDLSIDPEMLGRIFENLLAEINPETGIAARKSTGSYYTPRKIVGFMVDEGIQEYLLSRTKIEPAKLHALISVDRHDDLLYPLTIKERSLVIQAITDLKCLDPACGSGAFPMGLLHKLLWVISQVDPEGDDYLDAHDFEGTENWHSHSRLDFLRKRKLIRDVIYGSDIQSVAIEISKLRCFLTLVVDQEIQDDQPNRGVIPLPNLEFKFICADSLTPLDEGNQVSIGDDQNLEKRLDFLRKKYFTAASEDRKQKIKSEYIALISGTDSLFGESKRQNQIKSFNPFTENNKSKFFDPRVMYGISDFDIVIGNPPYVSVKAISNEDKSRYSKFYETGRGRFNLFTLFIERGFKFLKENGNLIFIIPDGLFSHSEYRHIRKFMIKSGRMVKAVLFSKRVFDAAIDTAIIQLSNSKRAIDFNVYRDLDVLSGTFAQKDLDIPDDFIFPFMVESQNRVLIEKIRMNGTLNLKNEFEIQQGIIYSGQKKEDIFSNTKLTVAYKPSLDGRDVLPFQINWRNKVDNLYIKYTTELHRPRDERLFLSPIKIMMPRKSTKLVCSVDTENFYALNTAYVLVPKNDRHDIYFIAGIINSSLMSYYYMSMYFGWQVTIPALSALPICDSDPKVVKKISDLSKSAHDLARKNLSISEVVKELDQLVYQLYSLSDEEVEIIEKESLNS